MNYNEYCIFLEFGQSTSGEGLFSRFWGVPICCAQFPIQVLSSRSPPPKFLAGRAKLGGFDQNVKSSRPSCCPLSKTLHWYFGQQVPIAEVFRSARRGSGRRLTVLIGVAWVSGCQRARERRGPEWDLCGISPLAHSFRCWWIYYTDEHIPSRGQLQHLFLATA